MLNQILHAAAPRKRNNEGRPTGITVSQLFPCPYRLYLVHTGQFWNQDLTPQMYYNMDDGAWQEEQTTRRLEKAGISIINRQASVAIGKSEVPGHIDGEFIFSGETYLWEHKAYDAGSLHVADFQSGGLDSLPMQKAQVNGYLIGMGDKYADFFIKLKNNNTFLDEVVKRDDDFILPILEWCDKIRLEGWVPEPQPCAWCTKCGYGCFDVIDFSKVSVSPDEEVANRWIEGDKLEKVGKLMKEEVRRFLLQEMGETEVMEVAGLLRVKRISFTKFVINQNKLLETFGPEGLMAVGEEQEQVQYRFKAL